MTAAARTIASIIDHPSRNGKRSGAPTFDRRPHVSCRDRRLKLELQVEYRSERCGPWRLDIREPLARLDHGVRVVEVPAKAEAVAAAYVAANLVTCALCPRIAGSAEA